MSGARLPGAPETERIVLHVDMDCFYAACERLREPALEGEAVVVGMGYESGGEHGAVATASYEAREYGVQSAQPISKALERLPRAETEPAAGSDDGATAAEGDNGATAAEGDNGATAAESDDGATAAESDDGDPDDGDGPVGYYRPVDIAYYKEVSRAVKELLHEVADTVREVSIDEAYLDVTDQVSWEGVPVFAQSLKDQIEARAGVPASVGVAPNMSAAKLASDYDKPDGLVVVEPAELSEFLAPISIDDVHGVGPVTARKLREMGIETAGDLASADRDTLSRRFGEHGRDLHDRARGIDPRAVEPVGDPKSLSSESSLTDPTDDPDVVDERLSRLADEVCERADARDALYKTIGIKVVTPPFDVHTRARSLSGPVADRELVGDVVADLVEEFRGTEVRKLGVRVSNLSFADEEQASLSSYEGATTAETSGDATTPSDRPDTASAGTGVARADAEPTADADADAEPTTDERPARTTREGDVTLFEAVERASNADEDATASAELDDGGAAPTHARDEATDLTGHLDRRYRRGQTRIREYERCSDPDAADEAASADSGDSGEHSSDSGPDEE